MTDDLTPEHWQHIDTAEAGTTATAYLDAAAAAIAAPRLRSHQLLGIEHAEFLRPSRNVVENRPIIPAGDCPVPPEVWRDAARRSVRDPSEQSFSARARATTARRPTSAAPIADSERSRQQAGEAEMYGAKWTRRRGSSETQVWLQLGPGDADAIVDTT
jgi:hypothetical protein